MTWHARLELAARRDDSGRCTVHARHQGPLRVLKTLYPEGDAIAHQVIVHPPGGIVGGDRLDIELALQPHTHTVVTTPGATRFYRSDGRDAAQVVLARVGAHARLEWLPLETLVHSGCLAENRVQFELDDGGQLIGWDVVALGLPAVRGDRERLRQVVGNLIENAVKYSPAGSPVEVRARAVDSVLLVSVSDRGPGIADTEAALRDHLAANLARYKVPKHVVFVDSLPRNATGKVRRVELRARAATTFAPA